MYEGSHYRCVVDHAVEREGPGAMVHHHAQIGRIRLRNSMCGHTIHAGEKFSTEGGGETSPFDFNISLFP